MSDLIFWLFAGAVLSVVGCVAAYLWDLIAGPSDPHSNVDDSPTEEPAVEPAASAGRDQLVVEVPDGTHFVLVLDGEVRREDLIAVRVLLARVYGPRTGRVVYLRLLDAYAAHACSDLDAELAALCGDA